MRTQPIFFAEWADRAPGERRSVERAGLLAERLGLGGFALPVLTVVGSKGKGTAAAYASACVAAGGLRVLTTSSPSYRSDRERVRVDGRALSPEELADLAALLAEQVRALPDRSRHGGYLSPVGLFTLAGLVHAGRVGADVVVAEAGQGGRSDEVSLFPPMVAAVTPIFAEHLGRLGRNVAEIAADKAGVVGPATRAALSLPQSPEVWRTLGAVLGARTGGRLAPEPAPAPDTGPLAGGLGRANAWLGVAAGRRLLEVTGRPRPDASLLGRTLESVRLPGRLSWHRVPGSGAELLADSAISGAGIAAALAAARDRWDRPDHVLLCLPDHKDLPGAVAELADLPVTFVRLPDRHLRFERRLPDTWRAVDATDLTAEGVAALGRRLLALGTVYFVGRILDLVGADTEQIFTPAR
ncbi:hypothetical protein DPM19_34170 [Actinomadura craniellae]|uniref:Bifunctional folylpolyglutamate synthase/dihydrofolate synthase n=1 Tax=Actinomadura craniellae TaxID=2231787 RepID=A0A365GV81_9ACTN|nr:hypothetical protein [Actinomadura craniellae]RAY10702.1 hypothetical protein DPM19_34170 [Actinomadura craniellae]